MSEETKITKTDIQKRIKDEAAQVSIKEIGYAWAHSHLRNLPLTVLGSQYTALPIDLWQMILEYNGTDATKYANDNGEGDHAAIALAGAVAGGFKLNGMGLIVDTANKRACNLILVHDAVLAADKKTAHKALKLATIEVVNDLLIIETASVFVESERGMWSSAMTPKDSGAFALLT